MSKACVHEWQPIPGECACYACAACGVQGKKVRGVMRVLEPSAYVRPERTVDLPAGLGLVLHVFGCYQRRTQTHGNPPCVYRRQSV